MIKGEQKKLKKLLNPSTIAVIGASADERKIGNIVVRNLDKFGYKGEIFLINPHIPDVNGHRAFGYYADIPVVPDLAIITTPAKTIAGLLKEIAQKGTKNVLIFAAGFKEIGKEGERLQNELTLIAEKNHLNILGPNCLGFINTAANVNATFGTVYKNSGNIKFISQSGAIATGMFDWATEQGVGFGEFITIGNKAVLNENDFLEYWRDQKESVVVKNRMQKAGFSKNYPIGLYLESISDGKRFINNLSEITKNNPVVILKPGKSVAANKAMLSHTGSIAGNDKIFAAAMEMSGVIRAEGIEDLFDLLKAFSWENAPKGPNVAIVSNAGGPSVITTDCLEDNGLNIAPLSKTTDVALKRFLPREAAIHNPIDVLGDADASRYHNALEAVLKDKNVDSVIAILTPQVMTQIETTATVISDLSKKYKKTILCSFMGGLKTGAGDDILNEARIPSFQFPERAAKVLGKMWQWNKDRKLPAVKQTKSSYISESSLGRINHFLRKIKQSRSALSGYEVNEILVEAGVHMPPYSLVSGFSDALEFAHRFEYPIALKITSPAVVHKTDIGGVFPDVSSSDALAVAIKKLQRITNDLEKKGKDAGIMAQKTVPSGVQVIIGIKKDEVFGRFLMIGAGGIYANLFQDQSIIILPSDKESIIRLLNRSKIGKILTGYRTGKPYAIEKLMHTVLVIDELMTKCEIIKEIEINPVILTADEIFAVDARAFI